MAASEPNERNPIATFVITKVETSGYAWEQWNSKIVELYCIAVSRQDLAGNGDSPTECQAKLMKVFHHVLDPERYIDYEASQSTGFTNDDTNYCPTFQMIFKELYHFLAELPKPVCLVAHNGNSFDFRYIRNECNCINRSLPEDLLCADSKLGFQKLLKGEPGRKQYGLPALYKRFVGVDITPMRAEEKTKMLLQCIMHTKDNFLSWADENCKSLLDIQPFISQEGSNAVGITEDPFGDFLDDIGLKF